MHLARVPEDRARLRDREQAHRVPHGVAAQEQAHALQATDDVLVKEAAHGVLGPRGGIAALHIVGAEGPLLVQGRHACLELAMLVGAEGPRAPTQRLGASVGGYTSLGGSAMGQSTVRTDGLHARALQITR